MSGLGRRWPGDGNRRQSEAGVKSKGRIEIPLARRVCDIVRVNLINRAGRAEFVHDQQKVSKFDMTLRGRS
jgi:hypothetical protein